MSWEVVAAIGVAVLSTIGVVLAARIGHDPRRERLLKDIEILERTKALGDDFPSRRELVASVDDRIRWMPKTWAFGAVIANLIGASVLFLAGMFVASWLANSALRSTELERPVLAGVVLIVMGGWISFLAVRWAYWALKHMP